MYGAIIGDIVGSKYEFNNIKMKEFPFVSKGCEFTDDSIMTVAVARALLKSREENVPFKQVLVQEMQELGRKYPSSYGGMFAHWLVASNPKPYNSFGNGSAMRVSPCGLIAVTLDEALELAKASSEVTHNHPEGIKGAQATAAAIFLARIGKDKEEIRNYIQSHYYNLTQTLDEIRPTYYFNETCQLISMKPASRPFRRRSLHSWNRPAMRMPFAMRSPLAGTAILLRRLLVQLPGPITDSMIRVPKPV